MAAACLARGSELTPSECDALAFAYKGKAIDAVAAFSAKHGQWQRMKLRVPVQDSLEPYISALAWCCTREEMYFTRSAPRRETGAFSSFLLMQGKSRGTRRTRSTSSSSKEIGCTPSA